MRYAILVLLLGGCMSREAREEARLDRLSAHVAAQGAARGERETQVMARIRARQAAAGTLPYDQCSGVYCDINGQLNDSDMTEARERRMRIDRARKRSSREGRRAIHETERRLAKAQR